MHSRNPYDTLPPFSTIVGGGGVVSLSLSLFTHTYMHTLNTHPLFAPSCSTIVGDIAEVKAIKKVFNDTSHLKMNATKSMIGHCLGAAAGIEAVAVVKAIQTGYVHPTLNQYNLVEEVAGIDTVPFEKKKHTVRQQCRPH